MGLMRFRSFFLVLSILTLSLSLALALPAFAQITAPLDQIINTYKFDFATIQNRIQSYAINLFWILAGIEFTWAAIKLALTGADLGDWLASLVNQILFIGLFFAILTNAIPWGGAVIDSFRQAGTAASQAAGGQGAMSPTDIFSTGIIIARQITDKLDLLKPTESLVYAISSIIILICFALIAAMMILTLVVAYGIVSMGILFLGFGGSHFTKDVAIRVIMAVIGVGAKLFVMEIVIGIGEMMIQSWANSPQATIVDTLVMLGNAVVMLALVKVLPDMVQSMINGSAFTSGGVLTGTAAAVGGAVGGAMAGTAVGVIGAGSAVAGAGRLASEQLAASPSAASSNHFSRMANFTGKTAKNLGSAAYQELGARIGGRAHARTMFGGMADNLHSQANSLATERKRPSSPSASSTSPPDKGEDNIIRPA